jgi:hypothetical protein
VVKVASKVGKYGSMVDVTLVAMMRKKDFSNGKEGLYEHKLLMVIVFIMIRSRICSLTFLAMSFWKVVFHKA